MANNNNIEISFNPTKDQLNEIKKWLIEEKKSTGESFYNNWNIIKSSFNENELITISVDKQTIGFVVWSLCCFDKYSAKIDITAIKPSHRNKGFGRKIVSELILELINKNVYTVELECSPRSSEQFWRHLGFIDFPAHNYRFGIYKQLYKIIVPHLVIQETNTVDECIELWDNVLADTKELDPTWKWNLIFKNGTSELEMPIIHPCFDNDWRIRWKKVNKIIRDDKVKYFSKTNIKFGDFIVIKEVPKYNINE